MRWTLTSAFGQTQIFVTASVDETATTYEYGKITTLATGTQNQETIGAVDSGEIVGNKIIIKLGLDKINAAVGSNVLGTTSTGTEAKAQILIGSSLSGGLLLNSDSATGSDYDVSDDTTTTPTPTPTQRQVRHRRPRRHPARRRVRHRPRHRHRHRRLRRHRIQRRRRHLRRRQTTADLTSVIRTRSMSVSKSVEIPFSVRSNYLDAQINQNHGNQADLSLNFWMPTAMSSPSLPNKKSCSKI